MFMAGLFLSGKPIVSSFHCWKVKPDSTLDLSMMEGLQCCHAWDHSRPSLNLSESIHEHRVPSPDMTRRPSQTITGAVTAAVPGSAVVTDLATHRVTVTGTDQADKVEAAIRDAGYEPARV